MKEIKLKDGTRLNLYENIDELPIQRYWKLKELWFIDSQTPRDPEKMFQKFHKLNEMINLGLNTEAQKELQHIMSAHVHIVNEIDHNSLSFAVMIESINGVQLQFTEDNKGLKKTIENLSKSGLQYGHVSNELEELKKKLIPNFTPHFRKSQPTL